MSWLPTAWLRLCGLLIHLLDRWRPSRPGLRIVDHLGQPPPSPPSHFTYPRFTLLPPPHKSLIHSSPAFFFAKCALMCLRRLDQRIRARGGRDFLYVTYAGVNPPSRLSFPPENDLFPTWIKQTLDCTCRAMSCSVLGISNVHEHRILFGPLQVSLTLQKS